MELYSRQRSGLSLSHHTPSRITWLHGLDCERSMDTLIKSKSK